MFKRMADNYKERANRRLLSSFDIFLKTINETDLKALQEEELLERSIILMKRAYEGTELAELLPEAFALIKESARRNIGLEAFDEQILAGIALHFGLLTEMQTGEGKTLAAIFPAYLNALTNRGVHILTFNDYLAARDAKWMGPAFCALGISVGVIQEGMTYEERKKAYACQITYVTAKEAGFDYLRDFLCYEESRLIHRGFNYAIVDEADSILIDEARIPLVIATSEGEEEKNLISVVESVAELTPITHYKTDEYSKNVYLTDEGINKVERMLCCDNLYHQDNYELLCQVNNALHAEVLFQKDVDYIVRDGKVELVDEFTGRVADNRHWPDGLQAAVEAKEGLSVQSKGRILGQITLQSFASLYGKLSGMTGTARDSEDEFRTVYGLEIAVIPTHKPCIRMDNEDLVFTHKEAKYKAIIDEIVKVHDKGQPILVGTSSVKESFYVAEALKKSGVECNVLNARNNKQEALIIEQAGKLGAVTVSTNMAGRGTDIKLGGPREEERDEIVSLGGLYVIGTNHYESMRIDKQLRGRAGRQGDPGLSRFYVSLEDNLIKTYGVDELIPKNILPGKQEGPIENPIVNAKVQQVQRIIQGQISDVRLSLRRYSAVMKEQRILIHKRRMEILREIQPFNILEVNEPDIYSSLKELLGEVELDALEKLVALYHINHSWSDYLIQMNYLKEGIHLAVLGGKDPLRTYKMDVANAFFELQSKIEEDILNDFRKMELTAFGVGEYKKSIKLPESTWTYLVTDNSLADSLGLMLLGNVGAAAAGMAFAWPVVFGALLYEKFRSKKKKNK